MINVGQEVSTSTNVFVIDPSTDDALFARQERAQQGCLIPGSLKRI